MSRIGHWMQTFSGVAFYPLDPRPEEIFIEDIAHALSLSCRFGGQCKKFYSVAEHCILAAEAAPNELKLTTLMHDSSEAYLSDVVRPIKMHLTNYIDIEKNLEQVIATKFGLKFPYPHIVKLIDNGMLVNEMHQNMAPPPQVWDLTGESINISTKLQFWLPEEAEYEFLNAFHKYS